MGRPRAPGANLRRVGNVVGLWGLWRGLGPTPCVSPSTLEAICSTLEAIRITLEAIRITLEAVCVPLEAIRITLEAVCVPLEADKNRFRSFEAPPRPSQEG